MQKKILFVEKKVTPRQVFQKLLTSQGFSVKTSIGGATALDTAETWRPDLILFELEKSHADGVFFLNKYCRGGKPSVVIIMLGCPDAQSKIDKIYDLGADKYLLKNWLTQNVLLRLVKDLA